MSGCLQEELKLPQLVNKTMSILHVLLTTHPRTHVRQSLRLLSCLQHPNTKSHLKRMSSLRWKVGMGKCPQYKNRISLQKAGMDEHVGIGRSRKNTLLLQLQFCRVDTVIYPTFHSEVRHPLVPQSQSEEILQQTPSRQCSVEEEVNLQRQSSAQQSAVTEIGEQFEAFIRLEAICFLVGEWLLDMEGRRMKRQFRFMLGLFLHGRAEGFPINLHLLPLPFSLEESLLYALILFPFGGVRVGAVTLLLSFPFLFTLLKLQVPMTLFMHQLGLILTLLIQLTVPRLNLIPKPNDRGIQCFGVSLVATGKALLLLRWDDESEPMILINLGDAFGNTAVGQVYDLFRLPLHITPDPHQQLFMGTLNQRNNHWLPGGEEQ